MTLLKLRKTLFLINHYTSIFYISSISKTLKLNLFISDRNHYVHHRIYLYLTWRCATFLWS